MISALVEKFNNLSPAQQKTILIVGAVVAAIGPLVTIIGGLATVIGTVIPIVGAVVGVLSGPLLIVIAAVIAVIAGLYLAWKNNWGGMHDIVDYFIKQFKTLWEAFAALFSGDFYTFGQKLREIWDNMWSFLKDALSGHITAIGDKIKGMVDKIIEFIKHPNWKELGTNIILGIAKGITAAIGAAVSAAVSVGSSIKAAFDGFFGNHSPSRLMEKTSGANIAQGLLNGIDSVLMKAKPITASLNAAPLMHGLPSVGGGSGGSSSNTVVNIYNPSPEPATRSVNREMKKLSYLGSPL